MPAASSVRITNLSLNNFKAFDQFSLSLGPINILAGPNNCGKSTIISVLRALESGLRIAWSRAPQRIFFDGRSEIGYRIPQNSLPLSLENVRTNYNLEPSTITFNLSNRNKLQLIFPSEGGCVLIPEVAGYDVETAAFFKRQFPISLVVVPILGPIEHNELRRERSTVIEGLSTHRASRHFRSYWHYFSEGFDEFAELVKKTWSGMEIEPPELSNGVLTMFCKEDRKTRELYWVGFGFQIWVQLLTHLSRTEGDTLVVVDEPETYLHPDVQRQLLGIIRDIGTDVLLATHSSEIMAEADPSEIVLIDKRRRTGERLKDVLGVQRALDAIGSAQNITLASLARNRRVLFVEGDDDFSLLRRFARRLGLQDLSTGVISLQSKGFSSWRRITVLADSVEEALGAKLAIAVVYDRDFYCDEQITKITDELSKHLTFACVHTRKEIENYLLLPGAIARSIETNIRERVPKLRVGGNVITTRLEKITGRYRDDVLAQIMAKRWEYFRPTGRDLAEVNRDAVAWFNKQWNELDRRLTIVPGKDVLRELRAEVQEAYGVSLTDARIVESMHRDEIPGDLQELLNKIDNFRRTTVD